MDIYNGVIIKSQALPYQICVSSRSVLLSTTTGYLRTSVTLPSLTYIGGSLGGSAVVLAGNSFLTLVFIPTLTYIGPGYVQVYSNNANLQIPSQIHLATNSENACYIGGGSSYYTNPYAGPC